MPIQNYIPLAPLGMKTAEISLIKDMLSPFERNAAYQDTYACTTQERAETEKCQQPKVEDSLSIASGIREISEFPTSSGIWKLNKGSIQEHIF